MRGGQFLKPILYFSERHIEIYDYLDYVGKDGRLHDVVGTLKILPHVDIAPWNVERDILIYLPPSYASGERRYPVLYMQDGQNLFDSATAFQGHDWRVDETMERMAGDGYETIIVGIDHGGERRLVEYNPFPGRASGKGVEYISFLCEQLKPFIDSQFRTLPEHDATGVIGSSMGGLISLYAFFSRPEVFGLCGAMSPSLFVNHRAILNYVRQAPFNLGKIYIDNGTREPSARPLYETLCAKGYRLRTDLRYVAERGAKHTESAWARRFPGAIRFLLKNYKFKPNQKS